MSPAGTWGHSWRPQWKGRSGAPCRDGKANARREAEGLVTQTPAAQNTQ